jgi:hypothetical protein
MKGRYIAALSATAALAAGGATVAAGQGTGGTVGAKATGTQQFEVRIPVRAVSLHCPAEQTRRACFDNPKLASVTAGNGAVLQDGANVGVAHFSNVTTKRGRDGAEMFFATVVFRDGTVTLQGASNNADDAPPIPSAITGGTGAYAGARGVETEAEAPGGSDQEIRIKVTLTFIA